MAFPKFVGYKFGLDELFSSATKQLGCENEERKRSMHGFGSSSISKTPANEMEPGTTSHSSFSELSFETGNTGQGSVGGFLSLHGSFSGTAEGFNPSKKEGMALRNFSVNVGGMFGISTDIKEGGFSGGYDNKKPQQKKGTFKKHELPKGDPDWLPEQGSCVPNSDCKRWRPIQCQKRKSPLMEDEVSKPRVQNMASPNGLKNLLLSSGWMVVSQECSCDPIYLSPSGSVYGSLPKALEVFSRDASKLREKQCCSSQSVGSSSGNVAKRTHKREHVQRRSRIVTEAISENMTLPQQRLGEENDKESPMLPIEMECTEEAHKVVAFGSVQKQEKFCIQDECMNSEIQERDLSNVVVALAANGSNNCVTDIHHGGKFHAARRPMHVNGKHALLDRKFDKDRREGEKHTSKPVSMLKGDIVQKPVNEEGKVKETLSIPEEMGHKQVHEVMVVDKKLKISGKDECLNHERNTSNCFGPIMTKNDQKSSADMYQNGEYQGVRRSARINGRHVPVDDELDMEMWDGDFYFDLLDSGDILQRDNVLGKVEHYGKQKDKEGSPVPEKMRYREVHELLASCMADVKAESCNSTDMLMQDMLPPKLETDKISCKEPSPIPEEMIFRKVHQVLTSCLEDEKGKSCSKDDCSYENKKFDWSNVVVVKNDQDGDTKMHQDGELVGVRRSTRINGRHVPVDNDMDTEMWANNAFIGVSSTFVVNGVAMENKETTISSNIDKFSGVSPATGNMLFKQTSRKKFDYQNARNQKLLESNSISFKHDNISKRCEGIETPFSEKCSLSLKKNVAKSVMAEKRSPSRSKRKSIGERCSNGKKMKKRSGGCGLIVRTGKSGFEETTIFSGTKVTILSWLIDSGILAENTNVVYKLKKGKKRTLRGWVTRGGIRCNCCKMVLSMLAFEVHAGSNLHEPWNNTYLTSGKSLMQCQIEAWEKEKEQSKVGFQMVGIGDADPSDDTCGICADGGNLLCCDGCTSTFHQECVLLKSLPQGSWHCPYCSCAFCSRADHGEDKSDGTVSLLSCNQCGCKYHRDCVLENDMDKMGMNSLSYCGKNCMKVAAGLSDLLGISNPIGEGFSWVLVRHLDEVEGICSDERQSFILECNARLPLALLVLHECFIPLVDPRTGLDMTTQAVYNCGSNFNRLNYEGFYTVILEKDDEIISVATLRELVWMPGINVKGEHLHGQRRQWLHGTRLAEMPFIGTRPTYRRQGMCRRLLNAIEEMLSSLCVEKLIIPATPDMLDTWIKSFSFQQLEPSHKDEIRNLNMVLFADTTLLQKPMYYEKAYKARDEKQLDIVDGYEQGTNISHRFLNYLGSVHIKCGQDILNCYTPEFIRQGFEVATLVPREEIKATTSADDDTQCSILSEVSNKSVFDVFPGHSPLGENANMVVVSQSHGMRPPITLTSVDNVLPEASVCPENVVLPNRHVLMSAKC